VLPLAPLGTETKTHTVVLAVMEGATSFWQWMYVIVWECARESSDGYPLYGVELEASELSNELSYGCDCVPPIA